jgi:hypothetical protein
VALFVPSNQLEQLSVRLKEQRRKLHRELSYCPKLVETLSSLPASGQNLREVLITSGEINDRHGTGLLLSRLFSGKSAFNIHARSFYGIQGNFPAVELANGGANDRFAGFIVREIAALLQVQHILVVPYMPDDVHTALVLRQATRAPLATWVMDDQAVFSQNLSRAWLDDLFAQSDIRFVISPEMKEEYQKAFDFPFFVLPPTVSQELLGSAGQTSEAENGSKSCALIGNVWSARWLTRLESVIESSGWKVNCYGHGAGGTPDRPEFVRKGFVSEEQLARGLAAAPFVISPTGTGDDDDDSLHLTRLSLPSRLPYLLAVHKVPILVLGSAESCAARFVTRLGVGLRCGYSRDEFQRATKQLCDQQFNARCRENCRRYAALFGDNGLADWIWKSATAGAPIDSRFAIFDS